MPKLETVAREYAALWDSIEVRPEHLNETTAIARRILDNRKRYEEVAAVTSVPWFLVGLLHAMECSRFPDFTQHLHNGDPLTARTRQVPAGRPLTGTAPFAWAASATDAVRYDKLPELAPYTIERIAYACERFNGWGYRGKGVPSAYLWSYSRHYSEGKYVADGRWSATAVSDQPGAMTILRRLADLCPEINEFPREFVSGQPKAAPKPLEVARRSLTIYSAFVKLCGGFSLFVAWLCEVGPETADAAEHINELSDRFLHLAGVSLPWASAAAIAAGFIGVVWRRWTAETKHRVA